MWHLVYRSSVPECPPQSELERQVVRRIGWNPFAPDGQAMLEVAVTRRGRRLEATVVHLERGGGSVVGERSVATSSGDCGELISVLGLALSIVVDPLGGAPPPVAKPVDRVHSVTPPAPSVDATTPEPTGPAPAAAGPGTAVPSGSGRTRGHLREPGAGATVQWRGFGLVSAGVGAAPAPVLGGALGAGIQRGPWGAALEGAVDRAASLELAGGGQLETARAFGGLSVVRSLGAWSVGALLHAGMRRGATTGLARPRSERTPYLAAGGRISLARPPAGRLRSLLRLDVLVALTRATYHVDGEPAWTSPGVSASLGLGVEWGR